MQVTSVDEPRELRSNCPVAATLDLVGDRWTLLVLRDLFAGKQRYGELQASSEHIPTNILADRLKRLEAAGLIESEPYQQRPRRLAYRLTPAGRDLGPVIVALANWGVRYVRGTRRAPGVRIPATMAAQEQQQTDHV